MHLFQSHSLPDKDGPKSTLCILARKRLARNTRVVRQAKALSEAGFKVTVAAVDLPLPEVQALAPEVTYLQVLSKPTLVEFLRWAYAFSKTDSRLLSGIDTSEFSHLETLFYASIMVVMLQFIQTIKSGKIIGRIRRCVQIGINLAVAPFRMRVFFGEREVWRSTLLRIGRRGKILFRNMWFRFVSSHNAPAKRIAFLFIGDRPLLKQRITLWSTKKGISPLTYFSPKSMSMIRSSNASIIQFVMRIIYRSLRLHVPVSSVKEEPPKDLKEMIYSLSNAVQTVYFAWSADRALKGIHFDYCQAHDSYALLAASVVASRSRARLVYDAVEIVDDRSGARNGSPGWLKAWENRRDEAFVRQADVVFAVGGEVAKWTSRRYGIGMPTVVRNCSLFIDEPSENGQIHETLGLRADDKIVLLVGSVYRGQGTKALIESLSYLTPDTHLVLLGFEAQKGYFGELKEHAARLGVLDRFHILDPCPPHMVPFVASGADIGVIARPQGTLNNFYSLPNKIFEYIMARLPIASARLPDIRALVEEHGIGMIFNEENPRDIAAVITTLTEPETLREMKERVRRAAQELCWEREGQRYVEAIKRLENGHGVRTLAAG